MAWRLPVAVRGYPVSSETLPRASRSARGGALTLRRLTAPMRALARPALHGLRLPLRWLARQEALVLVTAFGIVLALYGFIELAHELREGEMRHFDERLLRVLRTADDPAVLIGPPWFAEAVTDITALGGTPILVGVIVCAVGYLLLVNRYAAAALVLVASAGGGFLSLLLKEFFGRMRPGVVPHLVTVEGLSFPSGHSMAAAVIYLTLGALMARFAARRRVRAYVVGISLLLTLLIGITRVCLGVHYPTDVLAGWAAGLGWALLCWLIARYLQHRGAVEAPPGSHKAR
jgi:undecaprenyl-diphosphatase